MQHVLHSFKGITALGNDGPYPRATLVVGPDGAPYGTTADIPGGGLGTICRIETSGAKTILFDFTNFGLYPPTSVGCFPGWSWPLTVAPDGSI